MSAWILISGLIARFVLMVVVLGSALAINEIFTDRHLTRKRWEHTRPVFPWTMFACFCITYILAIPYLIIDYLNADTHLAFAGIVLGIDLLGFISWLVIFAAWTWALVTLHRDVVFMRRTLKTSEQILQAENSTTADEVQDKLEQLKSKSSLFAFYGKKRCHRILEQLRKLEKQLIEKQNENNAIMMLQKERYGNALQYAIKAQSSSAVIGLIASLDSNWKETSSFLSNCKVDSIKNELAETMAYGSEIAGFRDKAVKALSGKVGLRRRAFFLWRNGQVDKAREILKDDREAYDWL